MSRLVVDASVAVKWVVEETGTSAALALRGKYKLLAPELLVPECANILWKKVKREELSTEEALFAARLLQAADIELLPTRALLAHATRMAIELDHPAYDCVYLATAVEHECRFITADERLSRKLARSRRHELQGRAISLKEAAQLPP